MSGVSLPAKGKFVAETSQGSPEEPLWFDLRSSHTFRSIRALILSELVGHPAAILEGQADTTIASRISASPPDLRLRLGVMLRLESLLVRLLKECGLGPYGSLQFPANVRVLNPLRKNVSREQYSTELLHCDSWSGAPSDSWNHLLYILTEPQCAYLEMRETLSMGHPLREYVGPYDQLSAEQIDGLREVSIPCSPGVLAAWPTHSPHRTNYGPTSAEEGSARGPVRVSVDFRARIGHPYLEDRNSPIRDFAASKMNSGGVYWAFPDSEFLDMASKVAFEQTVASKLSAEALGLRAEYLRAHYEGIADRD